MTLPSSGRWGNVMVDEFTPGIIEELEKQSNVSGYHIRIRDRS